MTFALKIDQIDIAPATILAPMEGITDITFRKMIRACGGCGLTVTEFVNCEGLTRDVERVWEKTRCDNDGGPSSVQIYGRIPENIARAAAMCEARGAQIIDLNLGCPAKKVVSGNAGSALMREPELCRQIFHAVKSAIKIPMTVKMRLGWSEGSMNVQEIAHIAESEGASLVAVHARTREEAYRGHSRWHLVRPVVEQLHIPVVINGDILTREDAKNALEASGAAGIMIGRGMLRNPWLMLQIAQDLDGGDIFEPTLDRRAQFVNHYLDILENANDISEGGKLGKFKCFIGYFTRGLAYSTQMREKIYKTGSLVQMRSVLNDYFEILQMGNLDDIFDRVLIDPNNQTRFKEGDPRRID